MFYFQKCLAWDLIQTLTTAGSYADSNGNDGNKQGI
jgi:hypothetical protein